MTKKVNKGNRISHAVRGLFSRKNESTMSSNTQTTEKEIELELIILYKKHFEEILTGNIAKLNKLASSIASNSTSTAESRFAGNLVTIAQLIVNNRFLKNDKVDLENPELPQAFKNFYTNQYMKSEKQKTAAREWFREHRDHLTTLSASELRDLAKKISRTATTKEDSIIALELVTLAAIQSDGFVRRHADSPYNIINSGKSTILHEEEFKTFVEDIARSKPSSRLS